MTYTELKRGLFQITQNPGKNRDASFKKSALLLREDLELETNEKPRKIKILDW